GGGQPLRKVRSDGARMEAEVGGVAGRSAHSGLILRGCSCKIRGPNPGRRGQPTLAEQHHSPEAGTLAALAVAIHASPNLDRILQKISDAARELCESDGALVMLPEPDAKSAVSRYWTGARRHPVTFHVEPGKGLGGLVLTTGGPVRTANYGVDPRFSPDYLAEVTASGMVAMLAVPIHLGGGIGGLIYV